MTIYELIDRLKTANDKNNDIFVIVRNEGNYFVARHVAEVLEIDGDVFIKVSNRGELSVSNGEFSVLKPNRKEQA
jgi:hypothetical protein